MNRDEPVDRLLRRTSAPDADARPVGVCLDAETLASWSDGSLTTRERELAEIHAADCGRCLEALAALARTIPAHTAVPWWSRWFSWRWVVPITASAVAVTLWVIPRPELQPVVPDAPQSIAAGPRAEPTSSNRADESAGAAAAARRTRTQAAPSPASKSVAEREEDASAKAYQAAADAQTSTAAPAAPPAAATAAAAAPPELPVVAPAPTGAPIVDPPAPLREEVRQSALRERRAASTEIISPHSTVRWRIAGTSVEQSIDSGRTWVARPTGTAATLVAGSSPSRTVCWVVGGGGTVLLTTDAESWRRLPFPETTDLAAVTALSAEIATVTTVDGRAYRTVDAGRTWALQETPSTPF
jgi:hypothetical protein